LFNLTKHVACKSTSKNTKVGSIPIEMKCKYLQGLLCSLSKFTAQYILSNDAGSCIC